VRIFLSGLRKLVRRPATWVTIGLLVGLLLLVFLAVGAMARQLGGQQGGQNAILLVTFPAAYELVLGFILGLGGLLSIVYAAAVAGSEWTWGTLKAAVARGESRSQYVLASFGSIVLLIAFGLLLAFAIGVAGAVAGAVLAGVPTTGITDSAALAPLPEHLARGWVGLVEQAALGYAVATVARSQLAGVGVGIAAYFGEQFGGIFLPDIVKYLPFTAANAVIPAPSAGGGPQSAPQLDPNTALLVVVAWLLIGLVVAALFTERAEIGG
jgi:ABC-type transport system involved in multi-copper enzyme maturation permease subunit